MVANELDKPMRTTSRSTPQRAEALQLAQQDVQLRISGTDGPDATFQIPVGTITVGTLDSCELRLQDGGISRRHCQIERTSERIQIRDLNSTNGTFVDGVAVESAFLRPGSRLRLGNVAITVEIAYRPIDKPAIDPKHYGFRGLVGQSPAMVKLFGSRDHLARSDVTILIQGETGTGKSVLARSIHKACDRRDAPFIVFDCSAAAPNLVDSALFGHEKGAFTGADSARIGALEAAGQGTLFIDEVTELSAELQPKLLRALEEREFTPLGSNKARKVQCRIIAASQFDARALSDSGKFRRDLYYRLAVVIVPLPPLRQRKEDIPLIVDQLQFNLDGSITPFQELPAHVRDAILAYDWPGNIRELRNYLERVALAGDDLPLPDAGHTLPGSPLAADGFAAMLDRPFREAKAALNEQFERQYLTRLVQRADHNVVRAAELSGINRRHLHDRLIRFGLDKKTLLRGQ